MNARSILRLLLDDGVPSPLRRFLIAHEVSLARDLGWAEFINGALIAAAEEAGFEGIVTCDKNWTYQQNLAGRQLAFVVLPTNIWPHLAPHVSVVVGFVDSVGPREYRVLELPRPKLKRRAHPATER